MRTPSGDLETGESYFQTEIGNTTVPSADSGRRSRISLSRVGLLCFLLSVRSGNTKRGFRPVSRYSAYISTR